MDQHRLERIRLLSSRFNELHGLRVSLVGACIAVIESSYLVLASKPTGNGALASLFIVIPAAIPGVLWLNRYYASRFGRQVWTRPNPRYVLAFLFAYNVIGWSLNTLIPSIPAGTPTLWTVALFSLWVTIRDWPWRAYYLGMTLAVAGTFTASASGVGWIVNPGLTVPALFVTTGVSMVVVGVLDHLLLVKLMKDVRVHVESPRDVSHDR
jgi:hypothetical protein